MITLILKFIYQLPAKLTSIINFIITRILLWLIWSYQNIISRFSNSHCRFYPSCSQYAKLALINYPMHIAIWLITKRLLKCNPYCDGGLDLLPKDKNKDKNKDKEKYKK